MATKRTGGGATGGAPIYAYTAPLAGHDLGSEFTVRVIVEPAADRPLTARELAMLAKVYPQEAPAKRKSTPKRAAAKSARAKR